MAVTEQERMLYEGYIWDGLYNHFYTGLKRRDIVAFLVNQFQNNEKGLFRVEILYDWFLCPNFM